MIDLQAGRELDVLVAERVMGWTKEASDGVYYWIDAETDEYTGEVACQENVAGYTLEEIKAWSPSTDIGAAWDIAEKLQMTITPNVSHPRSKWIADVELKGPQDVWLASAETAPLAICRAALEVVEQ